MTKKEFIEKYPQSKITDILRKNNWRDDCDIIQNGNKIHRLLHQLKRIGNRYFRFNVTDKEGWNEYDRRKRTSSTVN